MNRPDYWRAGLLLPGFSAALGLYGLFHYTLAAMTDRTWKMNATIWMEVATAIVLLIAVARLIIK